MPIQSDLQLAKNQLLEAIVYFVKRQELVAQAILDFGLDLNAMTILGAGGWALGYEDAEKILGTPSDNLDTEFKKALQAIVDNKIPKVKQSGIWQDKNGESWRYFLHGSGCRITNQATSEPVDWDCPSTIHFDAFKFGSHLEWQIEKFPIKFPHLIKYLLKNDTSRIEHNLIPELANEGKLTKDFNNLYRVS